MTDSSCNLFRHEIDTLYFKKPHFIISNKSSSEKNLSDKSANPLFTLFALILRDRLHFVIIETI